VLFRLEKKSFGWRPPDFQTPAQTKNFFLISLRPKKIICYRCAKNKKVVTGEFFFFLKIEEFPRISGNSREFLGIPKIFGNSRGDFLNFGKNKKKMLWHQNRGKKVVAAQR
jgi:hypothetical protein